MSPGTVEVLTGVASPPEGVSRTVRVWTPQGYGQDPARRYPVLYMHDGQTAFAHPTSSQFDTWCANVVVQGLIDQQTIEPWIIVAVDHTGQRPAEYGDWEPGGRAIRYAEFLVDTLKPWVDATYATRPEPWWTAVMGSSLGGLCSLHLGRSWPDVFGRSGALSPSTMWDRGALFARWERHTRHWTRIYLDAGEHEEVVNGGVPVDYGAAARNFYFHLRALDYAPHEVALVLEPGGAHHETDWCRRLPAALTWLLSSSGEPTP